MAFQRRQDPPITLAEVLELQPGDRDNKTWVNGVLTVGICDVKQQRQGFSAVLFDPENTQIQVNAKFFAFGIDKLEGQVVTISGQGMSWGEYKGACELCVGQKCSIQPVGQAQGAPQPAQQASPARSYAPARQAAPVARAAAPAGHPAGVRSQAEDIALGRASNNAVSLLREFVKEKGLAWLESTEFSATLYVLTSDLLAVEKAVAHKPAPTAKQRAGGMSVRPAAAAPAAQEVEEEPAPQPAPPPPAPKPVARAQPGPAGAAYAPAAAAETDDIPF